MAPVKFRDVGSAANDLINNDYCFDRKFKLKTKSVNGLVLTTEGTLKPKGVAGKLSAAFKPFDGITMKKVCVTTDGRFSTEASLDNALEGVTFTVKAEDGANKPPAGELCVDYKSGNATVNTSVDVCDVNGPTLYGASTLAYDNFLLGGEIRYNTGFDSTDGSPSVVDYNAALSYHGGDFVAALTSKKKLSDLTFNLHQRYSKDIALATTYNHSSKLLTVGGIYKLDMATVLQGKLNSKGIVSANAIQMVSPGVKLITSVEVDAKNFAGDSHKFGLQLLLG
ncbi:Voltage-dependent anion-selective channel [Hondaea fermentalgiana]|uniref:Voltage-dependent anion-selective channel n=1 Tax=Hondaea fermentalgiana TaxID=2315210 RepID=A0A2R5GJF9_9STRA|nr:Voltage-dependent anion-selective channel [Hondaea fermentalgiana]|eukprot:GBG31026.1 Voltage-dependent anion-selective channel [Hondaea fermentalgiana]